MFKNIISFIFFILLSATTCNGLLMEVLNGNFSFIIDDKKYTASVNRVYIGSKEIKDLVVPSKVEFLNREYTVNLIHDYAFEDSIGRIRSVKIPKTLDSVNENLESLRILFINNIIVKYSE